MKFSTGLLLTCITAFFITCTKSNNPLSLHPDNPHYFLFRGKPTILIGSTEHYGAVLNLDFDYLVYLDELAAHGLNLTRTFSGIYLEPQGAFGIEKNTLAPAPDKLICPWARSNQPGYANGGNKFDLNQWDEAYFTRLKEFIAEAGKRNIVVELDLFSNFYDTLQWKLCPMYMANNINGIGDIDDHKEILSLRHPEVLEIQERAVRKIVSELSEFDNLYYEVCNEPYFGDLEALEAWEQHMTGVIADAQKDFALKQMISQNIANGSQLITNANPLVSIFNFHYARPPVTVEMNYGLNKPIGDNETGFDGIEDVHYRTEAWNFMVAGGALFNNLDYSFTTDHERGTFRIPSKQPGGGGQALRKQFGIIKEIFDEIDFIHMGPDTVCITGISDSTKVRTLSATGKQYLVYLNRKGKETASCTISIELPNGNYDGDWIDTKTGEKTGINIRQHPGGGTDLVTPVFSEDITLLIRRSDSQ